MSITYTKTTCVECGENSAACTTTPNFCIWCCTCHLEYRNTVLYEGRHQCHKLANGTRLRYVLGEYMMYAEDYDDSVPTYFYAFRRYTNDDLTVIGVADQRGYSLAHGDFTVSGTYAIPGVLTEIIGMLGDEVEDLTSVPWTSVLPFEWDATREPADDYMQFTAVRLSEEYR